jgi:splicing factor 3A subunit 1
MMALPSGQEGLQPSALVSGVDMTPFAGQEDDDDDDGEPDAKKPRLDFMPEEQFMASSPPIVKLIVQVLGAEMTGVGQTLTVEASIRWRVGELKGLLQQAGCTIPTPRLKLYHQEKRVLLKDSNSLAFYNLVGGTILEAKTQERGGRKK